MDVELFINSQAYSQGRVLAYHFYNQYLNNKEQAKENILNFMLKSNIHNKQYLLKTLIHEVIMNLVNISFLKYKNAQS